MVTKHFCDVCGHEVRIGSFSQVTLHKKLTGNDIVNFFNEYQLDICHTCFCEIENFINSRENECNTAT